MEPGILNIDDVIRVAVEVFDVDEVIARQALEPLCYIPSPWYDRGFHDGLVKARDKIDEIIDS